MWLNPQEIADWAILLNILRKNCWKISERESRQETSSRFPCFIKYGQGCFSKGSLVSTQNIPKN